MPKAKSYRPEGQPSLIPHLVIQGAAQAIDFYKKAFGAKEIMRMPWGDKIGHAQLQFGEAVVYLADESPMGGAKAPTSLKGTSVTIHLYVPNVDAAFKQAVDAGAKPAMPPIEMFWGDRFCKVTDPFGHEWSMATHVEDVPPDEMAKRAEAAMKQMSK